MAVSSGEKLSTYSGPSQRVFQRKKEQPKQQQQQSRRAFNRHGETCSNCGGRWLAAHLVVIILFQLVARLARLALIVSLCFYVSTHDQHGETFQHFLELNSKKKQGVSMTEDSDLIMCDGRYKQYTPVTVSQHATFFSCVPFLWLNT